MISTRSFPIQGETQRRLAENDAHWKSKLILRAVATFFAFFSSLLFLIALGRSVSEFGNNDFSDGFALSATLLALLYNPIHIIYTMSLHSNPWPIHPAGPVTIDLLVWCVFGIPSMLFAVAGGWFMLWTTWSSQWGNYEDPSDTCFGNNEFSERCTPGIFTIGRIELAAIVFLGLLMLSHLILFVLSCIAAHRHRIAHRSGARRGGAAVDTELAVSPRQSGYPVEPFHPRPQSEAEPPTYTPASKSAEAQPDLPQIETGGPFGDEHMTKEH